MISGFAQRVLGLMGVTALNDANDNDEIEARFDAKRALWVRDYQAQPAQNWTPITPADGADLNVGTFRAIRFDTAGTVKIDVVKSDGTKSSGITRNVSAGEQWSVASVAVTRIYATGTTATGIDALG